MTAAFAVRRFVVVGLGLWLLISLTGFGQVAAGG
jgi:hypothetical protein